MDLSRLLIIKKVGSELLGIEPYGEFTGRRLLFQCSQLKLLYRYIDSTIEEDSLYVAHLTLDGLESRPCLCVCHSWLDFKKR